LTLNEPIQPSGASPVADASGIHPLAVVDPRAELGAGVQVGPFSVVGPHVRLGDGCVLHNNVTMTGHTQVGRDCHFYPGCVIGGVPQDLKYQGGSTRLEIGDGNVFREQCTAHVGTETGGGITRIGDQNMVMAGVHVGHDCLVGSRCIIANLCLLAGHVVVEDCVTVGGATAIHHFTTIGRYAMIGGMTKVTSDVPPFMTIASSRSTRQETRMVNGVGLQRHHFTETQIRALKNAFIRLYSRRARSSGKTMLELVHELRAEVPDPNVQYLCEFLIRSFECGRHGRYLESLRRDRVMQRPAALGEAAPEKLK
jgi:UDP-N-acetylglucosamine acyltransferase